MTADLRDGSEKDGVGQLAKKMQEVLRNPHATRGKNIGDNYCLTVLYRTEMTIRASPKFFFGAFAWEGFAYIASDVMGLSDVSAGFYFMTGLGAFVGILFSFLVVSLIFYDPKDYYSEFEYSLLAGISGGIAAGTIWQLAANLAQYNDFSFTEMFFFIYSFSFFVNFAAMVLLRTINDNCPKSIKFSWDTRGQAIWHDFLVAVVLGASDGFFAGTSASYPGNWLASYFGVYSNTNVWVAMSLAGAASLTGYAIAQSLLNILIGDNWTDPGEDETLMFERVGSLVSLLSSTDEADNDYEDLEKRGILPPLQRRLSELMGRTPPRPKSSAAMPLIPPEDVPPIIERRGRTWSTMSREDDF
jgi:hypothetical protein